MLDFNGFPVVKVSFKSCWVKPEDDAWWHDAWTWESDTWGWSQPDVTSTLDSSDAAKNLTKNTSGADASASGSLGVAAVTNNLHQCCRTQSPGYFLIQEQLPTVAKDFAPEWPLLLTGWETCTV